MREQGSSTYSVDESGWCLHRLAGLESVITPERIRHALAKAGRVNERSVDRLAVAATGPFRRFVR